MKKALKVVKRFLKDESGIGTVEIILILVVLKLIVLLKQGLILINFLCL